MQLMLCSYTVPSCLLMRIRRSWLLFQRRDFIAKLPQTAAARLLLSSSIAFMALMTSQSSRSSGVIAGLPCDTALASSTHVLTGVFSISATPEFLIPARRTTLSRLSYSALIYGIKCTPPARCKSRNRGDHRHGLRDRFRGLQPSRSRAKHHQASCAYCILYQGRLLPKISTLLDVQIPMSAVVHLMREASADKPAPSGSGSLRHRAVPPEISFSL